MCVCACVHACLHVRVRVPGCLVVRSDLLLMWHRVAQGNTCGTG